MRSARGGTVFAWGILLPLLAACSDKSTSYSGRSVVLLDTARTVVLSDERHPLFGVVGAVFFGDEIVVANGGVHELLFYDRAGHLQRTVGRRGTGPGEFQRLEWIREVGSALFASDNLLQRVSEFTTEGDFVRSTNITPAEGYLFARAVGVFPDGTILVSASKRMSAARDGPLNFRDTVAVLRYGRDGEYLDSVGAFVGSETYAERWGRGGQIYVELPLGGKAAISVHSWHYYVTNDSASAVLMYDTTGTPARVLPPDGMPPVGPLAQGDLDRIRRRVDSRFPRNIDVGGIGDRVPIDPSAPSIGWAGNRQLSMFRVDRGGNVWVLEFGGVRPEAPVWTVLRPDGSVRARVTAEEELNVLDADGEFVLVHRWDRDDAETVELRRVRW